MVVKKTRFCFKLLHKKDKTNKDANCLSRKRKDKNECFVDTNKIYEKIKNQQKTLIYTITH